MPWSRSREAARINSIPEVLVICSSLLRSPNFSDNFGSQKFPNLVVSPCDDKVFIWVDIIVKGIGPEQRQNKSPHGDGG